MTSKVQQDDGCSTSDPDDLRPVDALSGLRVPIAGVAKITVSLRWISGAEFASFATGLDDTVGAIRLEAEKAARSLSASSGLSRLKLLHNGKVLRNSVTIGCLLTSPDEGASESVQMQDSLILVAVAVAFHGVSFSDQVGTESFEVDAVMRSCRNRIPTCYVRANPKGFDSD
eukprot:TRINITY_DN77009_c0_g1_i1.p1 TRINITY_DN77009_c0_g1~~TRINITY_DN77009_c0_g1_i1.p1  ORF type:complete len:172 (+),score=21.37 TRINITY_DN77009_c0_g1_i1:61-576(+)